MEKQDLRKQLEKRNAELFATPESWWKQNILHIIETSLFAIFVIIMFLWLSKMDAYYSQTSTKNYVPKKQYDSVLIQNEWLKYNDSLFKNPRKSAPGSKKFADAEKRFQGKTNEQIKASPLRSIK